jgi:sulfate permease, SulP family
MRRINKFADRINDENMNGKKLLISEFRPKILTTIRSYNRKTFISDLVAGMIVGIVALPLSIAFAIASGVSPERGIITAVIGGFLISALGGSKVQIGGPTGAFIVIIYGIVEMFGVNGLIIATIMAGVMLFLMGLFRLGSVIKFMPYPIIVGFTSGIAVVIFSSQIQDILGLQLDNALPSNFIEKMIVLSRNLSGINLYSVGITLLTIIFILLIPRISKRIPSTLIALIFSTFLVHIFHFPVETIGSRFGDIPNTIPAPVLPHIDYSTFRMLLVPAFTIAMLGAIESLLSAMVADGTIGGNHRSNTELMGQGIANIMTPIFGGIPSTGAIARTMTNIRSGGKTPVAGIIHALVLLVILLFFGSQAKLIPLSCLAGILAVVAYNMSEWRSFKKLLRNSRLEVSVLLTTFFLTVLVDLTVAILFGIILAVVMFMKRIISTTNIDVLNIEVENETADTDYPILTIPEQVKVFEMRGPFFFGVANIFEEIDREVSEKPKVLVIRFRRVPFIDSTAINNFKSFVEKKQSAGIKIVMSHVVPLVYSELERNGIVSIIGKDNFCPEIESALKRASELV